jgi:uncharacterized protein
MADPALLIAGLSGRALASSARRAGYRPLVADFFGDDDTLAMAHAHFRLTADFRRGIDGNELLGALEGLAALAEPKGVVCATGFEDRPQLLADLAARWRLMGNDAQAVERAKDPLRLASLCRDLGIPHPEIRTEPPADAAGWLAKRRGGAGGSHIRDAVARPAAGAMYYQRHVSGAPVSALALANGRRAVILGFSSQWLSPTRQCPFRYGGAIRPAPLPPQSAQTMADATARLAGAMGLVGLNSIDFIVADDTFWVLEINPRPGATLDIFEPTARPLFALHVAACDGTLPSDPPELEGAMAQGFVYADREIVSFPAIEWPDWTVDRQRAGTTVRVGAPLLTVLASGSPVEATLELLASRVAAIRATIDAGLS